MTARDTIRLLYCLALTLGVCRGATADPPALQFTRLKHVSVEGGADIHAVPDAAGSWLVSGKDGLLLIAGKRSINISTGHFESLDARAGVTIDGQAQLLLSAIDVDAGTVRLFSVEPASAAVSDLLTLSYAEAIPETQCLYRDPEFGDISVFTVDALGMIEQRYVYDGSRQVPVDIPVRRFVGVPEGEACAVDDAASALYVAEQPLAIWRYRADAETDPVREPFLLRAPHGELEGEIDDIALGAGGELWVLAAETGGVYRALPGAEVATFWSLGGSPAPNTLAVGGGPAVTTLAVYDEDIGSYLIASAPGPVMTPPVIAARSVPVLKPTGQTTAVRRYGDAADDPAIFVDADNPAASLILGTDKREGLAVYGLDGDLRQFLPVGRLNNVDLLTNVRLGSELLTLVAASNRSRNTISLFSIENSKVTHRVELPTGLAAVYGLCMYGSDTGSYVFINDKDGRFEQYRLLGGRAELTAELVRKFRLPSQPEGCAADALTQKVYLGEEAAGVWVAGAEPDGAAPVLAIGLGEHLVADVEGMDVYRDGDLAYLVVSSQGSDSYAVFGLWDEYPLLTGFRLRANLLLGVDGVSETDGLAVTSAALPGYPRGLLVVQDGRNRMPSAPQNFKLVDWREIAALLVPAAVAEPHIAPRKREMLQAQDTRVTVE